VDAEQPALSPVLEPAGSTAAVEKLAATTKHNGLPSDAGQQAGSPEKRFKSVATAPSSSVIPPAPCA